MARETTEETRSGPLKEIVISNPGIHAGVGAVRLRYFRDWLSSRPTNINGLVTADHDVAEIEASLEQTYLQNRRQ